jgi:hypothetical protein
MILKLEERRDYPELAPPPVMPKIEINGFPKDKEEKPGYPANPRQKPMD